MLQNFLFAKMENLTGMTEMNFVEMEKLPEM